MNILQAAQRINDLFSESCRLAGFEHIVVPTWETASDASKLQAVHTVYRYMLFPDLTPENGHALYFAWSLNNGWRYGERYDDIEKTNPRLKRWHWLTREEQKISEIITSVGATLRFAVLDNIFNGIKI